MLALTQSVVAFRDKVFDLDCLLEPLRVVAGAGVGDRLFAVLGENATSKRVRKAVQVLRIEGPRPPQPFIVVEKEGRLALEGVIEDRKWVWFGLESVAIEPLEGRDVLLHGRRERAVRTGEIKAVPLSQLTGRNGREVYQQVQ